MVLRRWANVGPPVAHRWFCVGGPTLAHRWLIGGSAPVGQRWPTGGSSVVLRRWANVGPPDKKPVAHRWLPPVGHQCTRRWANVGPPAVCYLGCNCSAGEKRCKTSPLTKPLQRLFHTQCRKQHFGNWRNNFFPHSGGTSSRN